MTTDLILGTAGHIDHGKTALVRALTGVDTDRLPEEKKRGITIDLGFAELELNGYRLGIVDVPGHERFVRNMLAGASGIDLALLVVAADDSVKQQTREHLEILRLLGLQVGVIALTKCDTAEADWIDLVEEEVRELVAGSFLEDAPIIRTSAFTGQGVEELRDALQAAALEASQLPEHKRIDAPFRMALDRSFTIAGHGTVVTGSVSSGRVKLGDELLLEPGEHKVRVRGIQNHDRTVEEVHRGQRAAINLAGVHHDEIERGQELTTPGHLIPSQLMTVQLHLLASASKPLKNRARVRGHLGTAEIMAFVVLLDRDRLDPGESAAAQLYLKESAVAAWGQPFVLRSESPVVTIGGGKILNPVAGKIKRRDAAALAEVDKLSSSDVLKRAGSALYFVGFAPWQPVDLARLAGIENGEEIVSQLIEQGTVQQFSISPTRTLRVHRLAVEELFAAVEKSLNKLHDQFPLQPMLERARLTARFKYLGDDALLGAVLEAMSKAGRIELTNRGIALAGKGPQLSNAEKKLLVQIVGMYADAGFQPPSVSDIQSKVSKNQAAVPELVKLAAAQGDLAQIDDELFLHHGQEEKLRQILMEKLAASDGLTMSEIREILGTTRKYAVPFCEYLDRQGVTKRQGDVRVLA